jgi:DNA-directed RNA polymerase specialized sigma24 family protein
VLVLRFFADLDVAATADALAISAEAVRSLTHRAITSLREHGHEFVSLNHGEVSGAN